MDWFHFQGFQARKNHINGHTGQLSSASVLLSWAGSLGLTFVTLQVVDTVFAHHSNLNILRGNRLPFICFICFLKERESFFLSAAHILSTCVSCVLLAQICCCRSRKTILKNRNR